jgi:UDP-N-acetylglucosamine/UDP-N-acetylgalactosamine diphosphorylase
MDSKLSKVGQEHLLTFYNSLTASEKTALQDELSRLDFERLERIFKKATTAAEEPKEIKLQPFPKDSFDSLMTASNDKLKKWYDHGLKLIADNKIAVILLAGKTVFNEKVDREQDWDQQIQRDVMI